MARFIIMPDEKNIFILSDPLIVFSKYMDNKQPISTVGLFITVAGI